MMVLGGEAIDCKYASYPNICRWLGNMKKLGSWNEVNEVMAGFASAMKDQPFVRM